MWKCIESSWRGGGVVVGNINNHYHSSLSWVELSRIELRVDQYDVFCEPVLVWLLFFLLIQIYLYFNNFFDVILVLKTLKHIFIIDSIFLLKNTLFVFFSPFLLYPLPVPPTPPLAPISLFVLPIWVYCFGFGIRVGCTYRHLGLRVDTTVPISNLLIMVWRPSFLFHWDRVGSFISTPHFFDRGVYKHTWTNILLPSLFTLATYITY